MSTIFSGFEDVRSRSGEILIAEDDESNRFYLETVLKKANYLVHAVLNGKEAVHYCLKHPEIRLVLMDIRMPVLDGMEATREIKLFRKELPVIAITAFAMNGDEKRAREAGCDDYLIKPLNKSTLLERVARFNL